MLIGRGSLSVQPAEQRTTQARHGASPFKRFYRLERSRRTPGNGLGLSLVAAVARLHGARIEMVDNSLTPRSTVR
jgi:signal transduction histidine kinase